VIVRRVLVNRIYQGTADRSLPVDRPMILRVPAPQGGVTIPSGKAPDLIALAERVAIG